MRMQNGVLKRISDLRLLQGKKINLVRTCELEMDSKGQNVVQAYEFTCADGEKIFFKCDGSCDEQYAYIHEADDFRQDGTLRDGILWEGKPITFAKEWHI